MSENNTIQINTLSDRLNFAISETILLGTGAAVVFVEQAPLVLFAAAALTLCRWGSGRYGDTLKLYPPTPEAEMQESYARIPQVIQRLSNALNIE